MVEGGRKVEHDHGCGENDRTNQVSGISKLQRMQDQEWRARHRCDGPCAVADAVGDLFTECLFAPVNFSGYIRRAGSLFLHVEAYWLGATILCFVIPFGNPIFARTMAGMNLENRIPSQAGDPTGEADETF